MVCAWTAGLSGFRSMASSIVIQSLLPITFFAIGIAQQIIGFIFGTLMVSDEIS